jgi:hypothetical protein
MLKYVNIDGSVRRCGCFILHTVMQGKGGGKSFF